MERCDRTGRTYLTEEEQTILDLPASVSSATLRETQQEISRRVNNLSAILAEQGRDHTTIGREIDQLTVIGCGIGLVLAGSVDD